MKKYLRLKLCYALFYDLIVFHFANFNQAGGVAGCQAGTVVVEL